jgi:hippurate hydrolase
VRDRCETRIRAIVDNVCAAFGAKAHVEYNRGYPVTVNDPEKTEFMVKAAEQVGAKVDTGVLPLMGAEDFSYMLEQRPGAYIFIGNGDTAGVHHPAYDFNDEAAPYGASLWARIVETGMPARS